MERKTRARAETGIYLVIVAAILVVANIISFRTYKRVDMTKTERFSLSKGSARLVGEGLTKDLDITIYVTRGLPKHEAFIQDLTDLMNEYERASAGKLHYTVIEPKTDDERAKAKEDGMQEAAFGEGSKTGKDQALISKGFMGIAFKYGSEKGQIPMMSPDQSQGLEFWISKEIREIRDKADNKSQTIGLITGKDEIKIGDTNLIASQGRGQGPSMKSILEQAFPFYKFQDVDLQGGDAEINKELVGVIITQPGKDYTEKELRRIDQFLMQGNKALTVIASAVNLKPADGAMKAELNLHGLDKLVDGYGVEMKKDAVFDWARPAVVRVMTQGMPVVAGHPATVLAQHDGRADEKDQFLDQGFAGFFRLEELVFPFPSTLIPHPEKQPDATMKVVARTTPRSTAATTDTVDMKPARGELKPTGEYGQRAMAVAVEGKLKSAFGGTGDGIEAPAESKDKSRLLVISSSQFLANPYARAGNPPPMPPQLMMMGPMGGDEELMMISQPYAQQYLTETILAFTNTLAWMSGDSDLIAASAKLIGDPNLTYLDIQKPKDSPATDPDAAKKQAEEYDAEITKVQQRVQWTMILFPAALFALFGLLRWRWRESNRAAITLDWQATMKTEHKIYAGLGVLGALAGGLYLTRQDQQKQVAAHSVTAASADLPSIAVPKDDTDKITKIELTTVDKDDKTKKTKVTLTRVSEEKKDEKKEAEWAVSEPVKAKANASNVKSLLDNLKELKVKETIDRSGGSYDQYDLTDDKAVHVVAYKGGDKAVDLYFGKSGSRGQMARVGGKDGVYIAGGYSSYLYTREVKNWRETGILKFEDANAIQVEVTNKNGVFSFSKNGDKWAASLTKPDKDGKLDKPEKDWKKFDEGKVKDLLRAYKGLNAEDFGEAKERAGSGVDDAEHTGGVVHIKLKDNAGDLTIKVGKVQKGTSRWAWKDGGDTLYAISSWSADWATAEPAKFEKGDDKKKDDKAPPSPAPEPPED